MNLPAGIWLEQNRPNGRRDRYRVRRYRNHIAYHAGYYYTLEEAENALTALDERLERLAAAKQTGVPAGTLVGAAKAMSQRRQINPRAARIRRD